MQAFNSQGDYNAQVEFNNNNNNKYPIPSSSSSSSTPQTPLIYPSPCPHDLVYPPKSCAPFMALNPDPQFIHPSPSLSLNYPSLYNEVTPSHFPLHFPLHLPLHLPHYEEEEEVSYTQQYEEEEEDPFTTAAFTVPLTKAEKKREKKEQKEWKKIEKLEEKRQRVEDKMIAQQPTNMLVVAVPLVAGEDLLLMTTNRVPTGSLRTKVSHSTPLHSTISFLFWIYFTWFYIYF